MEIGEEGDSFPQLFLRKEDPTTDDLFLHFEDNSARSLYQTEFDLPLRSSCFLPGDRDSSHFSSQYCTNVGAPGVACSDPLTPASSYRLLSNRSRRSFTFTDMPELTVISFRPRIASSHAATSPTPVLPDAAFATTQVTMMVNDDPLQDELQLLHAMPSVRGEGHSEAPITVIPSRTGGRAGSTGSDGHSPLVVHGNHPPHVSGDPSFSRLPRGDSQRGDSLASTGTQGPDALVALHIPRLRGDASKTTPQYYVPRSTAAGRHSRSSSTTTTGATTTVPPRPAAVAVPAAPPLSPLLPPLIIPSNVSLKFGPRASSLSQLSVAPLPPSSNAAAAAAANRRSSLSTTSILVNRPPRGPARPYTASVSFAQPTLSSLRHTGVGYNRSGGTAVIGGRRDILHAMPIVGSQHRRGVNNNNNNVVSPFLHSPGTLSQVTTATSMGGLYFQHPLSGREPSFTTPSEAGGRGGGGYGGSIQRGNANRRLFSNSETETGNEPPSRRAVVGAVAMTPSQRTHSAALQQDVKHHHHIAAIPLRVIRQRQAQFLDKVRSEVVRKLHQEHGDVVHFADQRSNSGTPSPNSNNAKWKMNPGNNAVRNNKWNAQWTLCSIALRDETSAAPCAAGRAVSIAATATPAAGGPKEDRPQSFPSFLAECSMPVPVLASRFPKPLPRPHDSPPKTSFSAGLSPSGRGGASLRAIMSDLISNPASAIGPVPSSYNLYATPTASWVAKAHAKGVVSAIVGIPPQHSSSSQAQNVSSSQAGMLLGYGRTATGYSRIASAARSPMQHEWGEGLVTQPGTRAESEACNSEQAEQDRHAAHHPAAISAYHMQKMNTALLLEKIDLLFRNTSDGSYAAGGHSSAFSRQVSDAGRHHELSSFLADRSQDESNGNRQNGEAANSKGQATSTAPMRRNSSSKLNQSTMQQGGPSRRYAQGSIFERLAVTGTGACPVAAPRTQQHGANLIVMGANNNNNAPFAAQPTRPGSELSHAAAAHNAGAVARVATAVAPHAVRDNVSAQWMSGLRQEDPSGPSSSSAAASHHQRHTTANNKAKSKGGVGTAERSSVWERLYGLRPDAAPLPQPTAPAPPPMHHSHHPTATLAASQPNGTAAPQHAVPQQISPSKKVAAVEVSSRVQAFRNQTLLSHHAGGGGKVQPTNTATGGGAIPNNSSSNAFRRSQSPPLRGLTSPHAVPPPVPTVFRPSGARPPQPANLHNGSTPARAPVDSLLDDDWTVDPYQNGSTSFVLTPHGTSWFRNNNNSNNNNSTTSPTNRAAVVPQWQQSVTQSSLSSSQLPQHHPSFPVVLTSFTAAPLSNHRNQLSPTPTSEGGAPTPLARDDTFRRVASPVNAAASPTMYTPQVDYLQAGNRTLPLAKKSSSGIMDIPHSRTNSYVAAASTTQNLATLMEIRAIHSEPVAALQASSLFSDHSATASVRQQPLSADRGPSHEDLEEERPRPVVPALDFRLLKGRKH